MLLSRVRNNLPSNFAAHCLTVGHLGHELSSAVLALNSSFMSSKINQKIFGDFEIIFVKLSVQLFPEGCNWSSPVFTAEGGEDRSG